MHTGQEGASELRLWMSTKATGVATMHAPEVLSWPQTEVGSKYLCQVSFALAALP